MVLRLQRRRRASSSPPAHRPPPAPSTESAPVLGRGGSVRSPRSGRAARSADFNSAHNRWTKLATPGRNGLTVASEALEGDTVPRPADSMDSITLGDPGARHIAPALSESAISGAIPNVWVRTSSGHATLDSNDCGSVPSVTPSPALAPRPPRPAARPNVTSPVTIPGDVASPQSPLPTRQSLSDYGNSPGNAFTTLRWDSTEIAALKDKFSLLDAEGKGFLSRAQFFELFSSIIDDPGTEHAEHSPLFNFAYSLFYSSEESLNLKEFVAGMTILSKGSEEERLRYLFLMYDADASGYLNADEIKQVFRVMSNYAKSADFKASDSIEGKSLASLRRGNSENLEDLAIKALTEHDMDGDGRIGFEDFAKWCSEDPVVKTWMDTLCHDTARGVARLRNEREQEMVTKELESLGILDDSFWKSPSDNSEPSTSTVLPPTISHEASVPQSTGTSSRVSDRANESGELESPPQQPALGDPPPAGRGHLRRPTQIAIGSFEIDFKDLIFEHQIGSGSFATVWSCRWLDTTVAVKVFKAGPRLILNPDGTASAGDPQPSSDRSRIQDGDESFEPEFNSMISTGYDEDRQQHAEDEMATQRVRFLQEVSLLKSIRHPNLLLYMGACVDPQFPLCIVSELIDGGSLFDCLHGKNKVNMTLRQKMLLTQDIARGMLYLHGRDPIVLHRDLKSANILVELQNDDSFKGTIIDFGLSKLNSTQASLEPGRARGLTGSLVTMAPEVMNGDQYLPRSDVYSFGIVCWEIFTGRVPFGNRLQVAQLLMKVAVRGERPRFFSEDNVPPAVQSLIRECWDQDSDKRPDFLAIGKVLKSIKRDLKL